ncbi:MAG: hypothetical protein AB1765_05420 [Candidatus Hydrogenedentota bacterium]
MKGIEFVVDEKGKKRAVIIDLKRYGDLWEDFYDGMISLMRKHEPRESHESVKERLRKMGKLSG